VWFTRVVAWRTERERQRGYAINFKCLACAIVAELVIIATSLTGNWLLSDFYSHNDPAQLWMMTMAPIAYAAVEFCRVPMALAVRTQPSRTIRVVCIIGIALAALVTIKTISQLGEIMFRPRLTDVVQERQVLHQAQGELDALAGQVAAAKARVDTAAEVLGKAQDTAQSINRQVAAIPKDTCYATTRVDRTGQPHPVTVCNPNPTRSTVLETMKAATAHVTQARANYDAAVAAHARLDKTTLESRVTAAENAYTLAISRSQLHSFTAMVFGIGTTDVTDAQLHWFLRLFVFVPAISAGIVATIIALASVRRLPAESVSVDPAGLGALGAHLYAEAQARTLDDLTRIVEAAVLKKVQHA
jgi:hypothetical protein